MYPCLKFTTCDYFWRKRSWMQLIQVEMKSYMWTMCWIIVSDQNLVDTAATKSIHIGIRNLITLSNTIVYAIIRLSKWHRNFFSTYCSEVRRSVHLAQSLRQLTSYVLIIQHIVQLTSSSMKISLESHDVWNGWRRFFQGTVEISV